MLEQLSREDTPDGLPFSLGFRVEPGSTGEPLYLDVLAALSEATTSAARAASRSSWVTRCASSSKRLPA